VHTVVVRYSSVVTEGCVCLKTGPLAVLIYLDDRDAAGLECDFCVCPGLRMFFLKRKNLLLCS
jgi:hypothetical protein